MKDRTYDIIKNCALIVVPVTAFVASMISVWHIPYATELTATLTARVDIYLDEFLSKLNIRLLILAEYEGIQE